MSRNNNLASRVYFEFKSRMTRFAAALMSTLQELGWTQTRLAEESGIQLAQINKYAKGRVPALPETLETICKALPADQRAVLILAYLEDLVPESGRDLVKVSSHAQGGGKVKTPREKLPAEVRKALDSLAAMAAGRSHVGELIVMLNKTLSGQN